MPTNTTAAGIKDQGGAYGLDEEVHGWKYPNILLQADKRLCIGSEGWTAP